MLGGLGFQVVSLAIFTAAAVDFALRCRKFPQSWNTSHSHLQNSKLFKAFLFGLLGATVTIFIRSVFRCAELSNGFNGPLANDQTSFIILESVMIVLASLCLTCTHPGVVFKGHWSTANFSLRSKPLEEHLSAQSINESFNLGQGGSPGSQGEQNVREILKEFRVDCRLLIS